MENAKLRKGAGAATGERGSTGGRWNDNEGEAEDIVHVQWLARGNLGSPMHAKRLLLEELC